MQGARQRRSDGRCVVPTVFFHIDALSVFAACAATHVNTPADNAMLPHAQCIREQLDTKVPAALCWVDTRDMVVDGVTKVVVDRVALHPSMSVTVIGNHEVKAWTVKYLKRTEH